MDTSNHRRSESKNEATEDQHFQDWQRSYHEYKHRLALFYQWQENFQRRMHLQKEHHQSIRDAQADLERVKRELIAKQAREGRRNGFW